MKDSELTGFIIFFVVFLFTIGWIPLMLPFGFADAFTSTLDYITIVKTVWFSAREMTRNLLIGKI